MGSDGNLAFSAPFWASLREGLRHFDICQKLTERFFYKRLSMSLFVWERRGFGDLAVVARIERVVRGGKRDASRRRKSSLSSATFWEVF